MCRQKDGLSFCVEFAQQIPHRAARLRIKAAVSDIGGIMAHAAIVSREYGLPAVVGTGFATKRIRTGQRVRVCR